MGPKRFPTVQVKQEPIEEKFNRNSLETQLYSYQQHPHYFLGSGQSSRNLPQSYHQNEYHQMHTIPSSTNTVFHQSCCSRTPKPSTSNFQEHPGPSTTLYQWQSKSSSERYLGPSTSSSNAYRETSKPTFQEPPVSEIQEPARSLRVKETSTVFEGSSTSGSEGYQGELRTIYQEPPVSDTQESAGSLSSKESSNSTGSVSSGLILLDTN